MFALSQCSRQLCICYNPPEYVAPCQHTPPALHSHCMRSLLRNSFPVSELPSCILSPRDMLPQKCRPPLVFTLPQQEAPSLYCVCVPFKVYHSVSLSLSLYSSRSLFQ